MHDKRQSNEHCLTDCRTLALCCSISGPKQKRCLCSNSCV